MFLHNALSQQFCLDHGYISDIFILHQIVEYGYRC